MRCSRKTELSDAVARKSEGDLWYVIGEAPPGYTTEKWYRYNGTSWDLSEDGAISTHTSQLQQQATEIAAKVSKTGGMAASFGWTLTSDGFFLYSDGSLVLECDDRGLTVGGKSILKSSNYSADEDDFTGDGTENK